MFVQNFPSGPLSTNAYLAACSNTGAAAIVDPAPESAGQIIACLKDHDLHCQAILLTHSHWDHIADVAILKKLLNVPVYIHSLDAANLENPGADGLPCYLTIPGLKADIYYDDLTSISLGHLNFQIIHTPGHSAGSICLYEPNQKILFSGDTLFKGTMGKISFPTSRPDLIWNSLNKLAELPSTVLVYPGHGPSTTIGKESWLPDAQNYFS